ncbi:TAM domain methyltransferase [Histoplasma capsulatum var. duboisii H88]|uniref:TAM domain methyltransferase n=1 Tax=Ajellomyces capsulatus (strain H88) TaxID=544711 RepID=A0A8A1LJX4_AJEC8|nr:TAM domain methyltransferase [Histoplasma capsulatum var. duboisii H88]
MELTIEHDDEIQKELDLQQQHGSPCSNTSSLASTVFNYRFQNGRRYHGLKDGSYFLPNDKREQDRMDLLHFIYRCVLSRRLYCAPIAPNPRRVLDLGTGTGNWAIEFADQHQKSQVLGSWKEKVVKQGEKTEEVERQNEPI